MRRSVDLDVQVDEVGDPKDHFGCGRAIRLSVLQQPTRVELLIARQAAATDQHRPHLLSRPLPRAVCRPGDRNRDGPAARRPRKSTAMSVLPATADRRNQLRTLRERRMPEQRKRRGMSTLTRQDPARRKTPRPTYRKRCRQSAASGEPRQKIRFPTAHRTTEINATTAARQRPFRPRPTPPAQRVAQTAVNRGDDGHRPRAPEPPSPRRRTRQNAGAGALFARTQ
ncbi:hypothetical protein KCP75_24885 [Salmonella enterica subsp. enterica]|nr:hypothetical protein KCP75_24885 [Salmonella enterica subsp. enterica]